ncbi:MAG: HepT-like ribonuclease domain-containing protein [Thermoplasmata archaeon]
MVHGYFGVELKRVWEVIRRDIPTLKTRFEKLKETAEKRENGT